MFMSMYTSSRGKSNRPRSKSELQIFSLVSGRHVAWLFTKRGELSSGLLKTNPASGREGDLDPGPPDYKSGALTTRPRRLPNNDNVVI